MFQAFLPSPRYGGALAVKAGCALPRNGWEAGPEIVAKARRSGFGLIVELAAGGRGVEARKGIASDPGDRNAKPRAVRGTGGACRRNQKARVSLRGCQADRSPATGGRQQCRPPFCVRALPGSTNVRALRGPNLLLPKERRRPRRQLAREGKCRDSTSSAPNRPKRPVFPSLARNPGPSGRLALRAYRISPRA